MEAEARRQGIAPEQIIAEQACAAFLDPGRLFKDGRLLPIEEMPEDVRRAVKTVKVRGIQADDESVKGVIAEIQLHDKLKALKDIGEHLGMYRKIHEHRLVDDLKNKSVEELREFIAQREAAIAQALRDREGATVQ